MPEQFDLVVATSVRAAFFHVLSSLPYFKKASNPLINISPPLNIDSQYFKNHLTFSLSKYAMSFCTLGMSAEFESEGIAVNSLWPETTIATPTIKDHFSPQVYAGSRRPAIMADSAVRVDLTRPRKCSGRFFTDEALLKEAGIMDFSQYAVDFRVPLMQALFLSVDNNRISVSQDLFLYNRSQSN